MTFKNCTASGGQGEEVAVGFCPQLAQAFRSGASPIARLVIALKAFNRAGRRTPNREPAEMHDGCSKLPAAPCALFAFSARRELCLFILRHADQKKAGPHGM